MGDEPDECDQCYGDGYCQECDDGKVDGETCWACDGFGDCQGCNGAGYYGS